MSNPVPDSTHNNDNYYNILQKQAQEIAANDQHITCLAQEMVRHDENIEKLSEDVQRIEALIKRQHQALCKTPVKRDENLGNLNDDAQKTETLTQTITKFFKWAWRGN